MNFSCALSARVKLVTRYTTFCLVLSGYSSKFVVNQTPYKWRPLGSHTTTDINLCFGQNLYVFLAKFVNRYETLPTFSRSSTVSTTHLSRLSSAVRWGLQLLLRRWWLLVTRKCLGRTHWQLTERQFEFLDRGVTVHIPADVVHVPVLPPRLTHEYGRIGPPCTQTHKTF